MDKFNDVIEMLDNNYTIGSPIDISVFFSKDGDKKLLDVLKKHRKPVFAPNDRLVLFFDKDLYLYDHRPGELINALQKYIAEIDISHCFIIVLSTHKQAMRDLETTRIMYSTDLSTIQHIQCADISTQYTSINPISNDTLCVRPWMHLYVGSDGNVLPCCAADTNRPMASIKTNSLDEIINSSKFKTLRKSMLEHKRPIECALCYALEDQGVKSSRMGANKTWKDKFDAAKVANIDGSVTNFEPITIDFRANHTCNFKCRMCTGYSSSKIQAEEKENNISNIIYNTLSNDERTRALHKIMPNLNKIEEIYFAGGEPLLIKEHYEILDYLIEHNKENTVSIRYNTNLSKLFYKNNSVIAYWKKFKNVRVGISIDETDQAAEYSRSGTIWADIEKNYNTIRCECPHVDIKITSTFSIYTAYNLLKMQREWISNGTIKHSDMVVMPLVLPTYVSAQILPSVHKDEITKLINKHIEFLKKYNSVDLINSWKDISKYLNTADCSFELTKFFKYNDTLDNIRNERFEDHYPEYANLRSYQ